MQDLDLHHAQLVPSCATHLLRCMAAHVAALQRLTRLNISHNRLGAPAALEIVRAVATLPLRSIDVRYVGADACGDVQLQLARASQLADVSVAWLPPPSSGVAPQLSARLVTLWSLAPLGRAAAGGAEGVVPFASVTRICSHGSEAGLKQYSKMTGTLHWLRSLSMQLDDGDHPDAEPSDLPDFWQKSNLNASLTHIRLSRCGSHAVISRAPLIGLTASMVSICVPSNGLTGAVLAQVLPHFAKLCAQLRVLDLSGNDVNAASVGDMMPPLSALTGLTLLDVSGNPALGGAGMRALCSAVTAMSKLQRLLLTPPISAPAAPLAHAVALDICSSLAPLAQLCELGLGAAEVTRAELHVHLPGVRVLATCCCTV